MTMKYPFVEDTLGKKLQAGSGLSVDCMTCHRNVKLDVKALVDRLGEDHGCMHWDLIKVLFCQPCREAGRGDRNLAFMTTAERRRRDNQALAKEIAKNAPEVPLPFGGRVGLHLNKYSTIYTIAGVIVTIVSIAMAFI